MYNLKYNKKYTTNISFNNGAASLKVDSVGLRIINSTRYRKTLLCCLACKLQYISCGNIFFTMKASVGVVDIPFCPIIIGK